MEYQLRETIRADTNNKNTSGILLPNGTIADWAIFNFSI